MRKVKWIVSIILILALVSLTLGGCLPDSSGTKAVGGGWIASASEVSGEKATFGFNAKLVSMEPIEDYVYESKGSFRLVDHGTDQKFRARIKGTYLYGDAGSTSIFLGKTSEGFDIAVWVVDKDSDGVVSQGDEITIAVQDASQNEVYSNTGVLQGGNINVK